MEQGTTEELTRIISAMNDEPCLIEEDSAKSYGRVWVVYTRTGSSSVKYPTLAAMARSYREWLRSGNGTIACIEDREELIVQFSRWLGEGPETTVRA